MEMKLDSVLIGWVLAGMVILLGVVSAATGAANGGFDLFLARLALPLGVGILIIAATAALKGVLDRRGAPGKASAETGGGAAERARAAIPDRKPKETAAGRTTERERTAASKRAGSPPRSVSSQGHGRLNVNLRLSIGNIGGSVTSVFTVVSIFLPWFAFAASFGEVLETSQGFTLREVATEGEFGVIRLFFYILLALGIVGLASMVLPRWVGIVTGIVGMVMTLITFIYIFAVVTEEAEELARYGVAVLTIPHIGFFLTGGGFLVVTVLRAIPGLNRPINLGRDGV